MFVLHDKPCQELRLTNLRVTPLILKRDTANFDLTWSLWETPQGLSGEIEYDTDLFNVDTIARMAKHYQTMLEGIVEHPEQRISDLPIMNEFEIQTIIEQRAIERDHLTETCIHYLFEDQVQRTPNAIAIVFENEFLTYNALNQRANQLAHYLQRLGVVPDSRIGICLERSQDMVVGLLAILKAGGSYVPLDVTYNEDRLAYILADARISILLTHQGICEKLRKGPARIVYLDTNWASISHENMENPGVPVKADNLAYLIYTSGSTGKPKGVMIQHHSVVNLIRILQEKFALAQGDHVLQFASISWDTSVEEIYPCLASGATLVLRTSNMIDTVTNFLQKCHDK